MRHILTTAGLRPVDVLSKRSKVYQSRSAEIDGMDDDELLETMVDEPTLIRRPLVVAGTTLVMGFDRERLTSLTDQREGHG